MDYRKIYGGSIQRTTLALVMFGLPTLEGNRIFLEDVDSLNNMALLVNRIANSMLEMNIDVIKKLTDTITNDEATCFGYKKKIELFYYPESNDFYPIPMDEVEDTEVQLRMVI